MAHPGRPNDAIEIKSASLYGGSCSSARVEATRERNLMRREQHERTRNHHPLASHQNSLQWFKNSVNGSKLCLMVQLTSKFVVTI